LPITVSRQNCTHTHIFVSLHKFEYVRAYLYICISLSLMRYEVAQPVFVFLEIFISSFFFSFLFFEYIQYIGRLLNGNRMCRASFIFRSVCKLLIAPPPLFSLPLVIVLVKMLTATPTSPLLLKMVFLLSLLSSHTHYPNPLVVAYLPSVYNLVDAAGLYVGMERAGFY
jgi:hypothetical protein